MPDPAPTPKPAPKKATPKEGIVPIRDAKTGAPVDRSPKATPEKKK